MTEDHNDKKNTVANEQRELEMVELGKQRFEKRQAKKTLDQTKAGIEVISLNVDGVADGLKHQLNYRLQGKGGPKAHWEKWLYRCDLNWTPDMKDGKGNPIYNSVEDMNLYGVANLACRVAMECYTKGMTLTKLAMRMGNAFHAHVFARVLEEGSDGRAFVKSLDRITQRISDDPLTKEQRALVIAEKRGYEVDKWTENALLQSGVVLWNAVLIGGEIFSNSLMKQEDDINDTYYPILREDVQKRIDERNAEFALLEPMLTPMLDKPRPWGRENIGPYRTPELAKLVKMVKNMRGDQVEAIQKSKDSGDLDLPMKALSLLGSVPYVINEYVVQAVDWVAKDADRARTVSGFPNIKHTPLDKLDSEELAARSRWDRIDILSERKEARQDNREAKSNKQMVQNWVKTAQRYAKDQRFYMPHQFDRRGRVYHAPEFGHHNTDALRGMFYLANKKPIGDEFVWLALALANNYGVDKVSLDDRQAWSTANEEVMVAAGRTYANEKDTYDVYGYVDDELKIIGKMTPFDFWRQADDPFQFLAACHELAEIRAFEERNPGRGGEFISGLPIALDAAQSGVQHFAASSLNLNDGTLTNLVPQDVPNDLYGACLRRAKELLREKLEADRAAYDANPMNDKDKQNLQNLEVFVSDESNDWDAIKRRKREFNASSTGNKQKLLDHIDVVERTLAFEGYNRSFIKRNGMTFSYSSRSWGFGEQLRSDEMKPLSRKVRLGELDEHPFGKDRGYTASIILGQIHERAIRDTVQSVSKGMDFLQSCSDALHNENKHFEFVTRWGFPVFQSYEHEAKNPNRPKLLFYNHDLKEFNPVSQALSLRKFDGRVHRQNSRQGIAPNLIHAQDALMLQMAVLLCEEHDITDMMVVHDSFATCIADVRMMRSLVLLAMRDLYDDYDLWAEVRKQVVARLENDESIEMIIDAPDRETGKLNLDEILKSNYALA